MSQLTPPTDSNLPDRSPTAWSWSWIPLALLAVILFVVVLSSGSSQLAPQDSEAIGQPAPRVDLVRLSDAAPDDAVQDLPQGKVTLLHFWGTWCGPCKMEYPHLSEMANELAADPRFEFLPISCEGGPGETFESLWAKTQRYFADAGIDSAAFADPQGITRRSAAERLGRSSMFFPTSMLIDQSGKIVGVWEGYTPTAVDEIEAMARQLMDAVPQSI